MYDPSTSDQPAFAQSAPGFGEPSGAPDPSQFVPPDPAKPDALRARAVRADLAAPWDGLDLVVFFIYAFGMLYLLSAILAGLAVSQFRVPVTDIERFTTTNAGFVVFRQLLWFACLLGFLYALVRRRTSQPFWPVIGWRSVRVSSLPQPAILLMFLGLGAALGAAADIASLFYNTEKRLPIQDLFESPHGVAYLMFFGIAVAPLAEETVFRGFAFPALARKFGITAGIIFTGVLFGLVHVPQLRGGYGQIATLVFVGIALTVVRNSTRSVYASYLTHLGYNTFLFSGFLIEAVTRHRAG